MKNTESNSEENNLKKRLAPYSKMGEQLRTTYCDSAELQNEFPLFYDFIFNIRKHYKDSPLHQEEVWVSLLKIRDTTIEALIYQRRDAREAKETSPAEVPISKLIQQSESHTLEFKERLTSDAQKKQKNGDVLRSLKTIAGFLNASGGTLLIGVDDSGKIKGIGRDLSIMKDGNNDKFQLKIRNCLKDRFQPQPISKVNISFEKFPEGTICRVDVQASEDIIHLDNRVYVREGNTTQLLDGRTLTDWIQQRKLLTALPSGK